MRVIYGNHQREQQVLRQIIADEAQVTAVLLEARQQGLRLLPYLGQRFDPFDRLRCP